MINKKKLQQIYFGIHILLFNTYNDTKALKIYQKVFAHDPYYAELFSMQFYFSFILNFHF